MGHLGARCVYGQLPAREIMTGVGPVGVRQPRVRTAPLMMASASDTRQRSCRDTRAALKSLEVLIPILLPEGHLDWRLRGKSAAALVGKDAPGLSGINHCPPQGGVDRRHARWQKRDLSAKRYVYCWADGIHLEARLEEQAQCMLVIIGATPEGRKELVGFTDGIRESTQSWRDLLLDLKRRGRQLRRRLPSLPMRARGSGRRSARCGRTAPRATLLGAQDREHLE